MGIIYGSFNISQVNATLSSCHTCRNPCKSIVGVYARCLVLTVTNVRQKMNMLRRDSWKASSLMRQNGPISRLQLWQGHPFDPLSQAWLISFLPPLPLLCPFIRDCPTSPPLPTGPCYLPSLLLSKHSHILPNQLHTFYSGRRIPEQARKIISLVRILCALAIVEISSNLHFGNQRMFWLLYMYGLV
jgi:hypothetical protein